MNSITKICKVENCCKPVKATMLCSMHWARLKIHGDVNAQTRDWHGMNRSPEHVAWKAMKQRCYYVPNKEYKNYGGRGIKVCDEWLNSFSMFFAYIGKKPTPAHSLDRIDTNGNYEPGNVKWSTSIEQMNNTSRNIYITYLGETKSLANWARALGINRGTLYSRYSRGMPPQSMFTKKVGRWV